ncbi:MAG: metallophosphoesterase [bacterium]
MKNKHQIEVPYSVESWLPLSASATFFLSAFTLALLLFGAQAFARDSDGRLALIRYPISSQPEFARAGEQITVDVSQSLYDSCPDALRAYLEKDGSLTPLEPAARLTGLATGTYRFALPIPQKTAPGAYGIIAKKCAGAEDSAKRSVVVVDAYPDEYSILHITDIHVGRMNADGPVGASTFERMREMSNAARPALVIITGDLSDTSNPEELKKFIEILEGFDAPTFVVAGNHDRNNSDADSFIGPVRYSFNFGKHFFLGFDTQYEFPPPDPDNQMNWIKKETRARAAAPFKVLFSHRADSDFRFVITKVVMPYKVNLLLLGHKHSDEVEKLGASYVVTTNAAVDGFYRVIRVKDNAVVDLPQMNLDGGK